jgi:urease beta subunit
MAEKWSRPPIPESVLPSEAFAVGEPGKCGHIDFADGDIEINAGRRSIELVMINTGDRPIQIGAHYHLAECNRAMAFDREAAFGMHLDIPSGSAVRFEPGQSRKVQLTCFVGREVAYGMNNMTNGTTRSEIIKEQTMQRLRAAGFCFEGERFESRTRADARFAAVEPADSQDGSKS